MITLLAWLLVVANLGAIGCGVGGGLVATFFGMFPEEHQHTKLNLGEAALIGTFATWFALPLCLSCCDFKEAKANCLIKCSLGALLANVFLNGLYLGSTPFRERLLPVDTTHVTLMMVAMVLSGLSVFIAIFLLIRITQRMRFQVFADHR
ncbi:Oidioi.mRNA.OKI2018_I69.XSR.g15102.t1.cds [Oikopleura dioica]|uniref:Oidioi.mRNA.OKI2018_I69.XSR.g15102.t1.cds n=1 Tax=Oikopleura dioica TaxID=34765 RepID=A0ABN7SBT1_OIKDI|nr:Oidioi.mRNA.OKI2018_I69.XSR.g15102.t1.cds [Oikopleura dioica]